MMVEGTIRRKDSQYWMPDIRLELDVKWYQLAELMISYKQGRSGIDLLGIKLQIS